MSSMPSDTLANRGWRTARRIAIGVVGSTVLLIGIAMIVLPGPAFVVIPAGLGILAIEFTWARRWLHRVREMARQGVEKVRPSSSEQLPLSDRARGRDRASPPS